MAEADLILGAPATLKLIEGGSGRKVPLDPEMPTLAIHSRSDGIVDWRACLDPYAECVEVDGSHCGMAVNVNVYRELERLLEETEVSINPDSLDVIRPT